ncbi:ABC transporter substrate-binding protein [Phenylobacterium aquaticum]|uniref:ABC transporter substrate-binding protein n=1 Tax=Phenylobacterium aquaticum TaxID=1763816 RepID=UPI0026EEEE5E|nr:ABC transporter substrate-binding protein [Phenylobacterium aquaticum]
MASIIDVSRRGVLLGAAALTACAPRAKSPGAGVTLRVGTYKGGVQNLLPAAGLADTPYKVAYSEFAGGNLITEAISARAIDIGSMSEIPPIFAAGKAPLLRLAAVQRADVNSQVVLVPDGSAIRTGADLKGRRVGFVKATTSHYFLLRLLAESRLTFADIQPVALSPQDGLAAFGRGAIDAWVIYGVQGNIARARLNARVLTTGLGRLSGNFVHAALSEALDDAARRAAIVDYLGRLQKAYQWGEANAETWAAAQSKATGVPAEIYLQQHKERSGPTQLGPVTEEAIASQQQVADTFAKAGVIPAAVDVRPLWTTALNADLKSISFLQ